MTPTVNTSSPDQVIVMLDDEKSYVELLAGAVTELLGRKVVTFTRARDALQALPALSPGIVVTDFFMPQMDGLQFVEKASALCPGVPFIMITGHSTEPWQGERPDAIRCLLQKPFGGKRLADEILRHWPGAAGADRSA